MTDNDTKEPTQAPEEQPAEEPVASPVSESAPSAYDTLAQKKGFKTPDDLARSYEELESHNKKVEMDSAKLEKMFFDKSREASPAPVEPPKPTANDPIQELDAFVNERVTKRDAEIRREVKKELERRDLREVMKEHKDFAEFAPAVKDLKDKYPDMPFTEAYTLAKASSGGFSKDAQVKAEAVLKVREQQASAQTAPPKASEESNIAPDDVLKGAGKRWTPGYQAGPSEQAVREIEQIERELFGKTLEKTSSGL